MNEIFKSLKLKDGNEMRFQISKAYCGYSIRIEKDYIINDQIINGYTLCMWDDYAFDVFLWDSIDKIKDEIVFIIDINDPLYFAFHELIMGIDELVIDSDEYDYGMKVMIVRKNENNDIELVFRTKMPKDASDRFSVFIKNVGFDLRSKIDCEGLDTKKRLSTFFEKIQSELTEDYHQINMSEYMLIRSKNNK